jgi:tryptophanyl-tRNA synthetase
VPRILTGIKPTGSPHLGNYLGMIRPALAASATPGDHVSLYFIADYHALTSVHDRARMAQLVKEVAATWLAFFPNFDPARVVFYRQSDVPETFELAWILACFTSKGWMNKAHAYKAQLAVNEAARTDPDAGIDCGLYMYPVLMAADILLLDSDGVPVGKDQVQHSDIAQRINHTYGGEVLHLPEALVDDAVAIVPGLDGRKMSKSYDNTIPLFLSASQLRKKINSIPTDSTPPEAPKDPATSLIFTLYKMIAPPEETAALADRYRAGIGWGAAKAELANMLEAHLAAPRARYEELMANPDRLDEILARGAERARALAKPVMERVRRAIGIAR